MPVVLYRILAVMVKFLCQLHWALGCPETWLSIISGCVCEGVSRRHYHLNQWTEQSRSRSPVCVSTTKSTEGLNRTKRQRKGEILSARLLSWEISPLPLDSGVPHGHSWFSGHQTQAGTYTPGFSGSPACGWQWWDFSVSIMTAWIHSS